MTAVFLLFVLSPVFVIIVVLQFFFVSNPLFIQERPGRYGRIFKMIKFRTLKTDGDDQSLTAFGRILRLTSLDELPQMINILRGEMSFIGPRPLLTRYLPHYSMRQRKRHEVKPGITGLAQVNGRNRAAWEESLEWDVKYVEQFSFFTDLIILIKTIRQIFIWKEVSGKEGKSRDSFHD